MGTTSSFKKLLPWVLHIFLFLLILPVYFYRHHHLLPYHRPPPSSLASEGSTAMLVVSASIEKESVDNGSLCDYWNGKWVFDKRGPLYDPRTCSAIKNGQNCLLHGRSDKDYLFWKWKPSNCSISRVEPIKFLQFLSNKHLAFIGDSIARNQLESLICILSTASKPSLFYHGEEQEKFRGWYFESHDVNITVYWSPFLVNGQEKSDLGPNHNKLYLDRVDERWATKIDRMDLIVFSIGHWFLHPAVYFEQNHPLGCHHCPGLNHTEIGFFDPLRKAIKTALKSVSVSKLEKSNQSRITNVILTTFSPSHFEGDWDKHGACSKTRPYNEGEKALKGMNEEIRRIGIEEVNDAMTNALGVHLGQLRFHALDVTQLSLMRPDGHPGPYMNPFPFDNGTTTRRKRVPNDCVHWCLPGPIDAWNEILFDMLNKWKDQ